MDWLGLGGVEWWKNAAATNIPSSHTPTNTNSPRPLLTNPKRLSYQQQQQRTPGALRRPSGSSSLGRASTGADAGEGAANYEDDGFDMRDDDEYHGPPPEAEFPDTDGAAKTEEVEEKEKTQQPAKSRFSRQRKAIEAALPGGRAAEQQPQPGAAGAIDPVAGVKVEGLQATAGGEEEDDPYSISAAAAPAPGAVVAGAVKWEEVVKVDGDGENAEPYVPFFWTDAHEQNGVIYLFGKVKVGEGRYVSAACSVQGVQHSLLVLPKRTGNAGPDGK